MKLKVLCEFPAVFNHTSLYKVYAEAGNEISKHIRCTLLDQEVITFGSCLLSSVMVVPQVLTSQEFLRSLPTVVLVFHWFSMLFLITLKEKISISEK
jgi:hypothetical protein